MYSPWPEGAEQQDICAVLRVMQRNGLKSRCGRLKNPKRRDKDFNPRRVRVVGVAEASTIKVQQADKADSETYGKVTGGKIQRPLMHGLHWRANRKTLSLREIEPS